MSATADTLHMRERARECARLVNAPVPRFEQFWAYADGPTRQMLLRIANADISMWNRAWSCLPVTVRDAVMDRARGLREWLLKVLPA